MHSKIAVFYVFGIDWRNMGITLCEEFYKRHLCRHKFIGKMRIYSVYQLFGAVTHPKVDNVRAHNELLAGRSERMPQVVLCNLFVLHNAFKHAI